ncbi:MAG: hypothetical protein J3K34DRAFT_494341 [Monoraphidium minutum]|nr:MAG: hypothetical protein J3K34DRAFT_494341 [Monoraphidium minutum]
MDTKLIVTRGSTALAWSVPLACNGMPTVPEPSTQALDVVVVANAAGQAAYAPFRSESWCDQLRSEVRAALRAGAASLVSEALPPPPGKLSCAAAHRWARALPWDWALPAPPSARAGAVEACARAALEAGSPPLRLDWERIVYTDGSFIPLDQRPEGAPGIGAACFVPGRDGCPDVAVAIDPRELGGAENTIYRAKQVAVGVALQAGALVIASDSAGVLSLLRRGVFAPQDIGGEHRHARMAAALAEWATRAGVPVTLCKVKSHSGVVGNERADRIATRVAKGLDPDNVASLQAAGSLPAALSVNPPSNDRHRMMWLSVVDAERDGAAEGPARVMRSLPNAREALQGHLRRVLGMGLCATDTVYYKLWRGAIARDLHGNSCLVNVDPSLVTFAEGRTMMRLRTGTQWTAKQAVRCGRARSDACGLCGQPDGGTHAAMACPATKKQRIARHNAAGRLVLRALAGGRLGAGLCMADVGRVDSEEDVAEDDVGLRLALKRLLPEYLAPPAARRLRPYIALLQPGPGGTVVHVVELKYCMDSGMGEVLTAAATQHAALLAHIDSLRGHSARLHVVPLGATGGVPRSLGATLEQLGVWKSALKRCNTPALRQTQKEILFRLFWFSPNIFYLCL